MGLLIDAACSWGHCIACAGDMGSCAHDYQGRLSVGMVCCCAWAGSSYAPCRCRPVLVWCIFLCMLLGDDSPTGGVCLLHMRPSVSTTVPLMAFHASRVSTGAKQQQGLHACQ